MDLGLQNFARCERIWWLHRRRLEGNKNVRFCRPENRISTAFALMAMLVLACSARAAAAPEAATSSFLKLTKEERYWWIHGAVTTTAHLVAMHDKQKGDCAAKWFLEQREAKQDVIEKSVALNPSESPTTIVLALLTRNCGELLPSKQN